MNAIVSARPPGWMVSLSLSSDMITQTSYTRERQMTTGHHPKTAP